MYYPIQIPFILNQKFARSMKYTEEAAEECGGFVICFWEMQPLTSQRLSVQNVIAADACIDLVAGYDDKEIVFAGMSKTDFSSEVEIPKRFFGARMMPGAFHQLTGLPAISAMDCFLQVESVFEDFCSSQFFSLPFEKAKEYLKSFLAQKLCNKSPDMFTALFNEIYRSTPDTAKELYKMLNFSPRQCQRLFAKHYGVSPKMALSIVRFQKCMEILTSSEAKPEDILNVTRYYDQPHFINDFKKNIGLTPSELFKRYK